MSHVATATQPPNNSDEDGAKITFMADTQKSDAHVSQLIAIANHSMQMLVRPDSFDERVEIDADAQAQARKTYELAHLQLRNLIDEPNRWSLRQTENEKQTSGLIDATQKLYDQKTTNAKIYNRPSVFMRPRVRLFNVGWICWTGDELPSSNCVHGIGESPALAMKAFDDAYYAIEKLVQENKTEPVALPPKPKKKK